MSDRRPFVRNASDPQQVRAAERKARRVAEERTAWVRAVMATYEGRAWMASLIRTCGVYQAIWDPSAKIHYNAGLQAAGHYVRDTVTQAAPEDALRMEEEYRQRELRDARELAAYSGQTEDDHARTE